MSRVLRLIVLCLVLILVGLISALTAMRIAIHGREVEVPKLIGLSLTEAEGVLADRGLRLELENRFYSALVPEGRIMSQLPAAGTVVRRGWRVRIGESLGTPRAKVPNVIGQSGRAAEINLRRRGLEIGRVAVVPLPNLPFEQVVAVSPPPESVGSSPKVTLLLTATEQSHAFVMPSLIGKKVADAEKVIQESHLRLSRINGISKAGPFTPHYIVMKQVPVAGSKVSPETVVVLDVSR